MHHKVQFGLFVLICAFLMPVMAAQPSSALASSALASVLPGDGKPPAQANGAELLEAVCPGHVESGEKLGCGPHCPSFTGFGKTGDDFEWSISRITRGHFLSPASDDTVLSTVGCESHSQNFGGTILLTRTAQKWNMQWYKPGVETSQCHKLPLQDAREILVCIGQYGGQGNEWTAVYAEDMVNPIPSLMAGESHFFELYDNTGTCGFDSEDESKPYPLTRGSIEKVEFHPAMISVTANYGRSPMTPDKVKACLAEQDPNKPHKGTTFAPSLKKYHVDFRYNGHDYEPTPASAATAKTLQRRER